MIMAISIIGPILIVIGIVSMIISDEFGRLAGVVLGIVGLVCVSLSLSYRQNQLSTTKDNFDNTIKSTSRT